MRKSYGKITYEVTLFELVNTDILTSSSDKENAYIGSGGVWEEFIPGGDDDD